MSEEQTVTVVNYEAGNLMSVSRAIEHCGARAILTSDPEEIKSATRLVLPGVGAFEAGMAGLAKRGLIEPIRHFARSGRPTLGICLGMQMLLDYSEEFGRHEGLGLIPGHVSMIPCVDSTGHLRKIPHIGWNRLLKPHASTPWSGTILNSFSGGEAVYFVHSFTAVPNSDRHRLADAVYQGTSISAVIRDGNLYGCQFHPEKSGNAGLQIIANFLSL